MKKTISLIVVLVLALGLLTGCSPKTTPVNTSPDGVVIKMTAAEHTPNNNLLYSYKDGLAADGTRLTAEEMLAQTEGTRVIPTPFTVENGGALDSGVYSVYDLDGNELSYRQMIFTAPEEAGEYLCVMEMTFGNEKVYSGYQIFFRFSVD